MNLEKKILRQRNGLVRFWRWLTGRCSCCGSKDIRPCMLGPYCKGCDARKAR